MGPGIILKVASFVPGV